MFKAKLEDRTELQVVLKDLPNFFKEHGKALATQKLKMGSRRTTKNQENKDDIRIS